MLSSAQLKEAFDGFDKDKSGFLDMDEVVSLATSLGVKTSKKELTDLFASIDVNHDNKASFEEFLAWYRVGKHSKLTKLLKYQLEVKNRLKKTKASMDSAGPSEGESKTIQYFNILAYDRETNGTTFEVNLEVGEGNDRMRKLMKMAYPMANPKDARAYLRIKAGSEEAAKELAESIDSFVNAVVFMAQDYPEMAEFGDQIRNVLIQVSSVGTHVIISTILENTEIGASFVPMMEIVVSVLKEIGFNGDFALSFSKSLKDLLKRVG